MYSRFAKITFDMSSCAKKDTLILIRFDNLKVKYRTGLNIIYSSKFDIILKGSHNANSQYKTLNSVVKLNQSADLE